MEENDYEENSMEENYDDNNIINIRTNFLRILILKN